MASVAPRPHSRYIGGAGLRGASGAISPGPYRSSRELSLTGLVGSDTRRPPTFVGNPGSTLQRPLRLRTYYMAGIMEEAISAADANRRFSLLLRGVREGRSYVVTSHGKPVARLIPADKHEDVAIGARAALLSRLKKQPVVHAKRWTRDELYADER